MISNLPNYVRSAGPLALSMTLLAACDEPDAVDDADTAPVDRAGDAATMPAPVGLWHLDEDCSTNVVLDDSPGLAHGQRLGGTGCVAGKVDRSAAFDGVDDRIEVADRPAFHFTTQMTAAAWVKPASTVGLRTIVNRWYSMDAYALYIVDGRYSFSVAVPDGGWGTTFDVSAPAVAGAWAHVAGVYDGTRIMLYVDGALVASRTTSSEPRALQASTRPLVIGNHPAWNAFTGQIDEVRLYDVSLSAAQVKALTRNEYYVATTGDDANPGTRARPFRTPSKGAKTAKVGDTVYIRGGVYKIGAAGGPVIGLYGSGTAAEPIVFRGYPGETAVLDGTDDLDPEHPIIHATGAYYDIVGLELANARKTAISLYDDGSGPLPGGRHIRILDNHIHHARKGAVYPDHHSESMHFEGNDVHHNVRENEIKSTYCHNGMWASAVNLTRRGDVVVDNEIYQNWGEGIGAYGTGHRVAQNVLHDNYSVDIYVNNIAESVIERNFIYSENIDTYMRLYYPDNVGCTLPDQSQCRCSEVGKVKAPAVGIGLANEAPGDTRLRDNAVVHNIILGKRRTGIQLTSWGNPAGNQGTFSGPADMQNTVVAHNTVVVRAESEAFRIRGYTSASDGLTGQIKNNIFYQLRDDRPRAQVGHAVDIVFAGNNWFGGDGTAYPLGTSPTDVVADPQLVDVSGTEPEDFMLTATSPTIDAGVEIAETGLLAQVVLALLHDHFGAPRPLGSGPDIGAHELAP